MSTKTIAIALGLGIVILVGVSAFLLIKSSKKQTSSEPQQTHTPGTPTKNIIELQKQDWVKEIVISPLDEANPSTVKIEKDWVIRFTNLSSKDTEIRITGVSSQYVVKIPAGKSQISPIFMHSGSYKFVDANNPKISGEIIVNK